MSALEQEIYEKFQQLDDDAKQRVRALIDQRTALTSKQAESGDWLDEARTLRTDMHAKYGKLAFSAALLVNEVREERLNELMDRY